MRRPDAALRVDLHRGVCRAARFGAAVGCGTRTLRSAGSVGNGAGTADGPPSLASPARDRAGLLPVPEALALRPCRGRGVDPRSGLRTGSLSLVVPLTQQDAVGVRGAGLS